MGSSNMGSRASAIPVDGIISVLLALHIDAGVDGFVRSENESLFDSDDKFNDTVLPSLPTDFELAAAAYLDHKSREGSARGFWHTCSSVG